MMKEATKNSYTERMLKVLVHIQNHLDEDLSLEELAGIACFSPYHFHRVFTGMVGEGLAQYVRRIRLQRAAHLLRSNQTSVTDLAFGAGYETVESFIRAFRKLYGMTPTCYRQRMAFKVQGLDDAPEDLKALLQRKGKIQMEVKIVKQDKKRLAFVRHVGPYADCGPAWEKLCGFRWPQRVVGPKQQVPGPVS
jgi:AraC family transcriptional regulator